MKTKFIFIALFIFAVMFVAFPQQTRAQYQPPDSCLKLMKAPVDGLEFQNPDSVKVDSCDYSPTYKQVYAKYFYTVMFFNNVKPRGGIYPRDTIIEFTWEDIDTNYQGTRLGFSNIENKYGQFYFRESNPNLPDTTPLVQRHLLIRFVNYINIDSVCDDIDNIVFVNYSRYIGRYGYHTIVNDFIKDNSFVYPNPASDEFRLRFQAPFETTVQLSIFDLLGNKVLSRTEQGSVGTNEKDINCEKLPQGYYYVKINVNENVQTMPLVIVK